MSLSSEQSGALLSIAVREPDRSSGGGWLAFDQIVGGLRDGGRCDVATFASSATPVGTPDVILSLGNTTVTKSGSLAVLWPLTVLPFCDGVRSHPSVSRSNRVRHWLIKVKIAAATRRADALVFGSSFAARLFARELRTVRGKPTLELRPGVRPAAMHGHAETSMSVAQRVLLVSALHPYKMVAEAVAGFELIMDEFPDAELHLAGGFPNEKYHQEVVARISRPDRVKLLGHVTPTDLAELYQTAEIVLFTSICEYAGSLSVYEAMSHGKPLVSSTQSSLGEAIEGSVEDVDPYDPASIASGLRSVLSSEAYRNDLAQRATERAQDFPTWVQRTNELVDFCTGLVDDPERFPNV